MKTHKDYRMFLLVILLVVSTVSDVTFSAPVENEKIEPVDLSYFCYRIVQDKENNKSPILLIHGITSSHMTWNGVYQVLALQTGRRVCAVDLRNHGSSPWSDRNDVEALTADIGHFLDEQKIQKVNIIGHSLGGKVGIHYTLNNPDRVDSLVVEDMVSNGVNEHGIGLVKSLINFLQQAIRSVPEGVNEQEAKSTIIKFVAKKVEELNITESIDEGKELSIRLVDGKWQWAMNLDVLQKSLENPDTFLTKTSGLFKGPTMFIYGTASFMDVSGDKENILELFPNALFVPVQGAGHTIHGRSREFEDEVIKFLNKIN